MDWNDFRSLLRGEALPAALVDLDALESNVDRLSTLLVGTGKTLRVASKSVRHVGVLRRILARGGSAFQGVMCYAAPEALALLGEGFDDLLIAYPTLQSPPLRALARHVKAGRKVGLVVDCQEHLQALSQAGEAEGATLEAILELDVSYRPLGGAVHLGARRSPVRTRGEAVRLARLSRDLPFVTLTGLMGYEAHIAGVPDQSPFTPYTNAARRAMKRLAVPAVARLRAEVVQALGDEGVNLRLVNGGGTGSVSLTAEEEVITEVTAGSGFLCPHLFSGYAGLNLEPAAFFALEVCRISDPGYLTCLGGGFIASGAPGGDRLPQPFLPKGLRYVDLEGAGEVQTPLRLSSESRVPALGEPVIFRHAKAGELAERFRDYLLVRKGGIEAREPTYRGMGWCFF